jgi:hypothetical protein
MEKLMGSQTKGGKRMKLDLTKKRMEKIIIFHAPTSVAELLRLAASHQEISRSDFIRQAIREKAGRVLAGIGEHLSSEVGSVVGYAGTAKRSESKE